MSEGTLNYRVLEQCSLSGTCHLSLVMLHTAYYHAIYGFSISCSCLFLHFIVCFFFFFKSLSGGNSHSSTQMNSYSDSGYQDASSGYHSSQNMGKAELRMQHSFPGACTGTLVRNARAEGQASAQVLPRLHIQHMAVVKFKMCLSLLPNNTHTCTVNRNFLIQQSLFTVFKAFGFMTQLKRSTRTVIACFSVKVAMYCLKAQRVYSILQHNHVSYSEVHTNH